MRSSKSEIETAVNLAGHNANGLKAGSGGAATNGKSTGLLPNAGWRRETGIESRLTKLGDRLAERSDAPFFTLMHDAASAQAATDSIRDASELLAEEAAALRWVLRIAKHSEGRVRARLWLDIDRALSALENLEMRILGAHEASQSICVDAPQLAQSHLQSHH
jgi:hypothetical protein